MFIIVTSCVIGLGSEVEAFREMMGNSSLGCRVRVGQMCQDRESGISMILLMVDLRVVDILSVDVILDMDELTAIGLSVIGTLSGCHTRHGLGVVRGYVCTWLDAYGRGILRRNSFYGGENGRPQKIPIF